MRGCHWLTGLLLAGWAGAQGGGTATDQAASLTYSSVHWNGEPVATLNGVDASGSPLLSAGWFYRAGNDTRERPLPVPDSVTYSGGTIAAEWNNVQGFRFRETTHVYDREGPSGGFVSSLVATNLNPGPTPLAIFHYLDVDLAGNPGGDVGGLFRRAGIQTLIKLSDGASRVNYLGRYASQFAVAPYPTLLSLLEDNVVQDLADTGLPFAAGDVTAAYEFGPQTLATDGVLQARIAVHANPPTDNARGDRLGDELYPPLWAQKPDLSEPHLFVMRRAIQFLEYSVGVQDRSVVGIDDFADDGVSDVLFRDPATNEVFLENQPLIAPILAANWKLSATGDFNGDRKADIVWRNTTSQKIVIWTMNGRTRVSGIVPSPDQAADANWEISGAADLNGDGNRDLLWYNQTTGKVVIWYMDAAVQRITGAFTTPDSVGNNNWKVVAVGDYGRGVGGAYNTQDIVWQNQTSGKVVIWYMDGNGARTTGVFTTPDNVGAGFKVVGPR